MTSDDQPSVIELLDRLVITRVERARFFRSDPQSALFNVQLLTAAAYYFNVVGVRIYGGRGGPARDRYLVEQVVAAAFQGFGGIDPHPLPVDKAAMLLRGITLGHPFEDGNKRTGFLVAAYYLRIMGLPPPTDLPVNEVVDLCVRVSAGEIRDPNVISAELKRLWGDLNPAR